MKRIWGLILVMGVLVTLCPSCYTLKSAAIPPDLKTINISFFENNAPLVVPTLSQSFTESLKDRVRSTTRLSIVTGEGDASMSGAIVEYRYAPISIPATNPNVAPIANVSALSITVHVKFVYDADKKLSFEQNFTKSINYTGDLSSKEQGLIQDINRQLIDEIFNTAFNNW